MSEDRLTPSEAHRKLMQMERDRDAERAALPAFRVLHAQPQPQPTPEPEPTIPRAERAARVLSTIRPGQERLKHRRTVVLSTRQLFKMLAIMPPRSTPSDWIREAIQQRLDREGVADNQNSVINQDSTHAANTPGIEVSDLDTEL